MSCEAIQQLLLDLGGGAARRDRIASALKHLKGCAACRESIKDADALREAFAVAEEEDRPVGGWEAFEDRLESRIAGPRTRSAWAWPTALAASILIAAVAFEMGKLQPHSGMPSQVATTAPSSEARQIDSQITPGELSHDVTAFHQISEAFDGRAGWMLVSENASDVGVADRALDLNKVLLLRFTLLSNGSQVSEADLVTVPGQAANVSIPLGAGAVVHYRVGTSVDEPTHLSLWAEIRRKSGSEPLAALSTDLRLQSGENRTAGELSTSAGKYVLNVAFERTSLPPGALP